MKRKEIQFNLDLVFIKHVQHMSGSLKLTNTRIQDAQYFIMKYVVGTGTYVAISFGVE